MAFSSARHGSKQLPRSKNMGAVRLGALSRRTKKRRASAARVMVSIFSLAFLLMLVMAHAARADGVGSSPPKNAGAVAASSAGLGAAGSDVITITSKNYKQTVRMSLSRPSCLTHHTITAEHILLLNFQKKISGVLSILMHCQFSRPSRRWSTLRCVYMRASLTFEDPRVDLYSEISGLTRTRFRGRAPRHSKKGILLIVVVAALLLYTRPRTHQTNFHEMTQMHVQV